MSAVSGLPCNQHNASVIAQRRLPLPICSDRVSSSIWLGGSVESPRAPLTPPIGHLIKSSDVVSQLSGTLLRPQPSAIDVRSPAKIPTCPKARCPSNGRDNAAVTGKFCYSPPELLQTPPYRASSDTVKNDSQSPPDSGKASQDDKFTTDKKSRHKLIKQVVHKVVERERRRKCNEIIMAMKTHFLPELILEVSSNSHKSVVPRNIVLEYSLAHLVCLPRHIICLQRKYDLLARAYEALLQKRQKDWHAPGKEEDRPRPQCSTAHPPLDPLRDPSPVLDSRDTPPASSPSSPATCKRADADISGNETDSQTPYRYVRRSPDLLRPLSNRSTTWQSDVADEIRDFVEKRKRGYPEAEEMPGRKRKRSSSDVTITAEWH